MKTIQILLTFTFFSLLSSSLYAQGFPPPEEGNAVVYFVRVTGYGGSTSFEFFHDQQFIGIFKKKNYMRYELPAGKHLLWASSENKEFLECELSAGETYLVLVNIEMGAWKARVGLEPVTKDNPDFERVKALVMSKAPVTTPQALKNATMAKLQERGFIENIMMRYKSEWQYTNSKQIISPEMHIPEELLH